MYYTYIIHLAITLVKLLRQIKDQCYPGEDDPLWGIVGIAEGPDDGITSENLDQLLYRTDWRERPTLKVAEDDTSDS